jgi:antitoxin HicB
MRYSMIMRWSSEDQKYLVELPEFPGKQRFVTHGATYAEAAEQGQEVLEMLVELYQKEGRPLPTPNSIEPPPEEQAA